MSENAKVSPSEQLRQVAPHLSRGSTVELAETMARGRLREVSMLELERARAAEIRARKGPHPAEHVEGECGYCAPVVPTNVPTGNVSLPDVPTLCEACGVRPREGKYRQCSGCRKAAQRARR